MNADEDRFAMWRYDIDDPRLEEQLYEQDRQSAYYDHAAYLGSLDELRSRIAHLAGPTPVQEPEW